MISPDWTLAVSALVFLVTLLGLNWLLFKPMFRVLEERKARTTDVFDAAGSSEDYYQSLMDQYQEKIKVEKQAGYRLAETVRDEALKQRQQTVAEARASAEAALDRAKTEINAEMRTARDNLRGDVEEIAALISRRILQGGQGS